MGIEQIGTGNPWLPIRRPVRTKLSRIPKKNLTWSQAKRRYPKLNPFGDADRDGVMNVFDCRPFNRRRQDDKAPWSDRELRVFQKGLKPHEHESRRIVAEEIERRKGVK